MKYIEVVIRGVCVIGRNTGAAFLLAVVAIMCANVAYRSIGGIIPGTFDLVELLVVPAIGFALVTVEYQRRHTVVDIVTALLPVRFRYWLGISVSVISLFYWAALCWAGYKMLLRKMATGETTQLLQLSVIPYRVAWVFALAWICVVIIYSVLKMVKETKEKK